MLIELSVGALLLVFAYFILQNLVGSSTTETIHVDGEVDKDFEHVRDVFRSNFFKDWEPCGAALAVFYKGKLVVDLWGGYADKEAERKWSKDTLNVTFSSTKAVSALCIAKLVDEGRLDYNDTVTKYWPKFGKNGKEDITVQSVISHTAGLPYFEKEISYEDALNGHEKIREIIEEEQPKWTPGSHIGYHPLTYGWLVDQLVRHADSRGRSLGQFYREEIRDKLEDIDYHLGLPRSEFHRVSRLQLPDRWQRLKEFLHNPHAVYYWHYTKDFWNNGLLALTNAHIPWMQFIFKMNFNNPDLWVLEQGAVLGIGTARALATLFQKAVMEDGLLKQKTRERFLTPCKDGEDIVTGANVLRGNGLMFSKFEVDGKKYEYAGHAGVGGQNIKLDLNHDLCFAYVSNGFKAGFGDTARTFVALRDAIYRSVARIESSQE
ncbi:unnamed protein product [Bursaphelenchus xylophilus]|uniref:(pine wood nematode) hypothetical protein n=1 Tax=Bursaphelenchus xylophilus TaxID=6326 RepID=A0A1I7SD44_BURXY|nr:unnamed protein product [Bursaphelenchus xylophilus]CAG9092951.1 unnamed protein product [Bursaphelenchus xylophilus]